MECLNIGYQGKSLQQFCDTLAENGVEALVDVRANAWSQRPEFRKGALRAALAKRDIEYVHCKIAGNPHRSMKGEAVDPSMCFALYATHLEENPEILETLQEIVSSRVSALLCYEARRDDCHRGVLLAGLLDRLRDLRIVDL